MMKHARRIAWALSLAAIFPGAVFLVLRYSGGYEGFLALAAGISGPQWAVMAAAAALFYLLDFVRFRALVSLAGVRLSPAAGLRLTCVTYFVSSLTPACGLHLPAVVYLLVREGVPAPQAAAVSITKSVYMVLWICVFAFATLNFPGSMGLRLPESVSRLLQIGSLPLLLVVLALLLLLAFPATVERWAAQAPAAAPPRLARWKAGCAQCARAISLLGPSRNPMHWLCHGASIACIGLYVFLGWYLCRGLGIPLGWDKAAAVFSNSLMVAYLSPVPGSVGITELATSYLIDPALTEAGTVAGALLRSLCWYAVMLPGALLLALSFRREGLGRWRATVAAAGAAAA